MLNIFEGRQPRRVVDRGVVDGILGDHVEHRVVEAQGRQAGPDADRAQERPEVADRRDRAGRIRYAKAAAMELDDLNRELVPLLLEPRPGT